MCFDNKLTNIKTEAGTFLVFENPLNLIEFRKKFRNFFLLDSRILVFDRNDEPASLLMIFRVARCNPRVVIAEGRIAFLVVHYNRLSELGTLPSFFQGYG